VLATAASAGSVQRPPPDVVIAHDFAETYGGAERIVAAIAQAFPAAPFWAILGRPEVASRMGVADRFNTVLPPRPALIRGYRALAPLYPSLVRHRELPAADVLLTSSYAFAHGFATENDAPQVCYCYSPLRFAWSMTDAYGGKLGGPMVRQALGAFAALMRSADRRAAKRVTRYIAESRFVADQIRGAYGVEADVIWPPVDCARFAPLPKGGHDDYFLFCGRLIEPYKRPFMAVEAFRSLPHRLVVAGDGPALPELRKVAPPNVEFVGHLDDSDLVPLMQRCAAAVFPSRDDFGLIPVEVMACGRPVLAFAGGGALETVVAGTTGEFFAEQTAAAMAEAIEGFNPDAYDPLMIRAHAERWNVPRFQRAIVEAVESVAAKRYGSRVSRR
jgi:glycosyltransferase involved in cell wall biosynthesis